MEVKVSDINAKQPKKKTFYTVEYAVLGAIHTNKRVFDNKKEAEEFAATNYCDSPVKHTIRNTRSNEEEIEFWENWLKEQKEEDEEWEENRKIKEQKVEEDEEWEEYRKNLDAKEMVK